MTCDESTERINLLVDGELSETMTVELYAHLGECVACRALLSGMLRLRQAIQKDLPPYPDSLDSRVLGDSMSRKSASAGILGSRLRIPLPLAAAALVVLAALAFFLGRESKPVAAPSQTSESQSAFVHAGAKLEILYALPAVEVVGYVTQAPKPDSSLLQSR